jgi:hypothetical protein
MKNLPGSEDLLAIARETLIAELRPLLGEPARYTLAMVANAMAIAAREIEAGEAPARAALARLDALFGVPARVPGGAALHDALREHDRRLARDIRSGAFDRDDDRRRAVIAHLRESVEARLRVSNPKGLES